MNLPPFSPEDSSRRMQKDFLFALTKAHHELGDVFRVGMGSHELYFVAHPEIAREVLLTHKDVFAKLGSSGAPTGLQLLLGDGLLTTTDPEVWRKSRRLLQPLFHQQQVLVWKQVITDASQRLIKCLKDKVEADIAQEMLQTTSEILYQIIFSLSPEQAKQYPLSLSLSLATAKRKTIREVMAKLSPVISTLLDERKKQRGQYNDMLEVLLEAQDEDKSLSDKNLHDELLTLFAAGHETTSYALSWTFYLLSQNPEAYEKLLNETRYSSDHSCAVAAFKESLRLYPVIPSAPRVALQNTSLGGFDIPKGARIFVSFYLIHRHKDYWSEPVCFRPERFLPKDPDAFMPFGLGQRYCLGKNLAMLQGPLVLAQVSKQLRLELAPETHISPKVTISLFPRYGIKMKVLGSQ